MDLLRIGNNSVTLLKHHEPPRLFLRPEPEDSPVFRLAAFREQQFLTQRRRVRGEIKGKSLRTEKTEMRNLGSKATSNERETMWFVVALYSPSLLLDLCVLCASARDLRFP